MAAIVVLSTVPAPSLAQVPRLVAEGDIGCDWCDGPEAFGLIRKLAFLPDGSVAVLDRDEPMIRVFAQDGAVSRTFGARGGGPGELQAPQGIVATADGDLIVADLRRRGLTRYDGSGELIGVHDLDGPAFDLVGDPDGRWIAYQSADWEAMAAGIHLLDQELTKVGTPLPTTAGVLLDADDRPVAPALLSIAVDQRGRIAAAHGSRYLVRLLSPDGSSMRTIERDVQRVPRTREEIAAIADARRNVPGGRPDNPEAGAAAPEIDPLRPHFERNALAWDAAGRLWIRTARGLGDTTVFDVFSPQGSFLGEVVVDGRVGVFVFSGTMMAGVVVHPETGVERVRRWRVEQE